MCLPSTLCKSWLVASALPLILVRTVTNTNQISLNPQQPTTSTSPGLPLSSCFPSSRNAPNAVATTPPLPDSRSLPPCRQMPHRAIALSHQTTNSPPPDLMAPLVPHHSAPVPFASHFRYQGCRAICLTGGSRGRGDNVMANEIAYVCT